MGNNRQYTDYGEVMHDKKIIGRKSGIMPIRIM